MSTKRLEGLLGDLVVTFGYSIPPECWQAIIDEPPDSEEELAELIVAAENYSTSAQRKGPDYHRVLAVVRRHWDIAVQKQAT